MSTQEEMNKGIGFGCCQSILDKCFNPESKEGKVAFSFKDCEKMMIQFCGAKDGKFDLETFRSKMEKYCKAENKESNDKVNK
jgi:hypothetical protein